MHIPFLREILVDLWMVLDFSENVFGEETLIVGHVEYLDVVALYATKLSAKRRGTYYLRLPVMRSLRK